MGVPELEHECNALAGLFQGLINDMRDSVPAFEELVNRSTKLHSTLRATIFAIAGFLEAFQKVADCATSSRGATKEIGKSLTRLCMRHRSIESKLKLYTNSLMEDLVVPLQEKLEDWKKNTVVIDKDHAKDIKRVKADIKRASSDTIRLQKKTRKGKTTYCKGEAREKLEFAMQGVTERYSQLEEVEKGYVRKALTEERKHYCDFICCVRPVVDHEMSMVNEVAHLQEIIDHLSGLAADPDTLPEASEQVITDIKGNTNTYSYKVKTPPDSPTSDRHSLSSSMNSLVSAPESDANSQRSASPANRLQTLKSSHNNGLLSVASNDSGFMSQDALFARPNPAMQLNGPNKGRSHGSLEEEKSDSVSVYSSISQGSRGSSHEYDTASLHSGSAHSVPTALQTQLRQQTDRAHTIAGVRSQDRPTLGNDTYKPPPTTSNNNNRTVSMSEYGGMGPPPRPQRMSSYEASTSSSSTVGSQNLRRSSTTASNNRSSMPARATRAKPKPVAMPSVPFMNTEPIYMNTQELAAKIAAKRKEQEEAESNANTPETAVPAGMTNSKPPTTKKEEIRVRHIDRQRRHTISGNFAAAVASMEASTAALENLTDEDFLVKAQNDALADAIAELEASTAALNDCLDEPSNRQSIVSSSGYGTTTSNSSASEEVQVTTSDTVDSYNQTSIAVRNSNLTNRISEEMNDKLPSAKTTQDSKNSQQSIQQSAPQPQQTQQTSQQQQRPQMQPTPKQHENELKRQAEGVEVTTWAGKAVMRRHPGGAKPPPPVRRSSSVTASMNGSADARTQSQRSSKPPVLSPKPKLTSPGSADSRVTSRTSTSSVTSENFPTPPPASHHDDEDPYAVPIPCGPAVDSSSLPPPPPEFGLEYLGTEAETNISFNISDLPPPIPDSPAPNYLTSQASPNPHRAAAPTSSQQPQTHIPPPLTVSPPASSSNTSTAAPWDKGVRSPRSNSKGDMPPPTLAKKGKKLDTNFLAQLNNSLGGPSQAPVSNDNRQSAPSAAVQNLKVNKSRDSPPRDHLLSQIHGGVKLKKAANVNDRSAPSV